jgi:hypothetical protein
MKQSMWEMLTMASSVAALFFSIAATASWRRSGHAPHLTAFSRIRVSGQG